MNFILKNLVLQAEVDAWVEDPPERVQYTSLYADVSKEEENASISKFWFLHYLLSEI